MNTFKILILIAISVTLSFSCTHCTEEDDFVTNCDQITLIDADEFANAPDGHLTINTLEIIDDCLHINFGASGCSGDTWVIQLIDAEEVLESIPVQRRLRLSLENNELCDAYFTKEVSFDISNLQVDGTVILNITNSGEQILYEF